MQNKEAHKSPDRHSDRVGVFKGDTKRWLKCFSNMPRSWFLARCMMTIPTFSPHVICQTALPKCNKMLLFTHWNTLFSIFFPFSCVLANAGVIEGRHHGSGSVLLSLTVTLASDRTLRSVCASLCGLQLFTTARFFLKKKKKRKGGCLYRWKKRIWTLPLKSPE